MQEWKGGEKLNTGEEREKGERIWLGRIRETAGKIMGI